MSDLASLMQSTPPRSAEVVRPLLRSKRRLLLAIAALLMLTFPGGMGVVYLGMGVLRSDGGSVVTGLGLLVLAAIILALVNYALNSDARRICQVVATGVPCTGRLYFADATAYVVSFMDSTGTERIAKLGLGSQAPRFWGEGETLVVHDPARPLEAVLAMATDGKLAIVRAHPAAIATP